LPSQLADPAGLGRAGGAQARCVARGRRARPAGSDDQRKVGPHRRIEWTRLPVAAIKEIREQLGGTLNDVVLATVAGGLRRFLAEDPVDAIKVACPVNVRAPGEAGRTANIVSAWILSISLRESDPRRRFAAIQETTAELKRTAQADGAQTPLEAAEWTGAPILHAAIRLISSRMPVNLVVTNVPGPPFALYLLTARMEHAYPFLPLFESQGLGIALFRYRDDLFFGLTGDWDLLSRLAELPGALEESFAELRRAAGKPASLRRPARSPTPVKPSAATTALEVGGGHRGRRGGRPLTHAQLSTSAS
jgi:WS/DGAT/MGAT family acyltransferase